MKVYALWHGGYSYAVGGDEDLEVFDHLVDAAHAFKEREESNGLYKCRFNFINREPESYYCPTVEGSEMLIYFDIRPELGVGGQHPDRIIKFGPRGGVQVENV